ncbi:MULTISPECIES: TetR/AcrR family transcriptional regulator [unclassified Roseovarius]|uniref:TetR/AcrR family transcriptional regulator n=1 Tax=unclassified Roseovarius TaxID=2614913 RepID=UPI00273EFE7C|nr:MULTISPECIES: TetR/AcrR family transcriptional regulator [unclassified Roseovarius]
MTGKVKQRRTELRQRLIDIAEARIAEDGMAAIKARDLAKRADCAVGAIYNVFGDLNDIIIAVNGRTFQRIGAAVAKSLEGREGDTPTDRLIAMSLAYLDFAAANPKTWRTLFDIRMSTEMAVPDWYMSELGRLFGYIAGPVSECFPDMSDDEVNLMTRALFSSVHGIVLLGLENRISGVPGDELERMIALVLVQATGNK